MEKGLYIKFGGHEVFVHDTIFQAMVIAVGLLIFGAIIRAKVRKADYRKRPEGLVLLAGLYVETIESLVDSMMAKQRRFVPYFGTLLIFLICCNLWGLLGFSTPTTDYNFTGALALMTFSLTQFWGARVHGVLGHLKGFAEPMILMLPLNVIGEIASPISLSVRIFGNILSGSIIMELVHHALGLVSKFLVPASAILHVYFDVFAGFLQAFIFVMLSMSYIGRAFPESN